MLDETPRNAPFDPPPLDPVETGPVGSPDVPLDASPADDDAPLAGTAGPAAPSAKAMISADMSEAWTRLDQSARLLFAASLAAIVIVLVGLPLSVWDSAPFALLVLTAGIITAVTAWFGASPAFRDSPIPRATIELVATLLVAVLAAFKAIEVLFDLDTDGIVGLVVSVALVGAAAGQVVAARQRGSDPLAFVRGDQGTKIAVVGLLLVLIGWAFNLSISFWTMGQAALPLAVLTIAALTVVEASRIESPVPVAWIGAGIAVFGAILALAHWNDLTTLGSTEITLDVTDFLGLTAYSIGVALIIAGGALSGRAVWAASHPASPGVIEG